MNRVIAALLLLASCAHAPPTAAPPLARELHDVNGGVLRLADLRGKVVLLDFWATWCEPCKLSLPAYGELHAALRDRGLVVVAVDAGESVDQVRDYLAHTPLPYILITDPETKLADDLGVQSLPTRFLIDRYGTIRSTHAGFQPGEEKALRAEIELLLAEH